MKQTQQHQVNSSPFLQTDLTSEDVSCEEVVDRDVQRYNRSANRRFMSHRGVTHILSWHLLHDLQHGERYDRRLFFFFKKKKKNCRKVISAVSSDGEVHCSPEANLPTQKLTPATTHSLFTHTVSLHISARRTQIHIWKTNVPHWAQAWIFSARTCE